jgi:hypothetical protein
VLCAKDRKIPKSDEVTITYCQIGNESVVKNGGMGGMKNYIFDDQICGCPHSDAEQHYMTGRHVNETYGAFGARICAMNYTTGRATQMQPLHREFVESGNNRERSQNNGFTDEELQSSNTEW